MSAPSEGVVHRQHQLDNGLVISAEIDPQAVSGACGFFVDTGARDEPSHLMGVSHFLEHMAFKGSGDLTGEAIDKARPQRIVGRLGVLGPDREVVGHVVGRDLVVGPLWLADDAVAVVAGEEFRAGAGVGHHEAGCRGCEGLA